MSPISRGFHRRREPEGDDARLPPGQYLTRDFPVLSAGPTPHTPLSEWSLTIQGAVGVEAGVAEAPALAEQVPELVDLDLERVQPLALGQLEPHLLLAPLEQAVLLVD